MGETPPSLNLVVIRSRDINQAVRFYEILGLVFEKHAHGNGPEHYSSEINGMVFEIYPEQSAGATSSVRLGFQVENIEVAVKAIQGLGLTIVSPPKNSEWGRRAVVQDFDGHKVELLTPLNHDKTVD